MPKADSQTRGRPRSPGPVDNKTERNSPQNFASRRYTWKSTGSEVNDDITSKSPSRTSLFKEMPGDTPATDIKNCVDTDVDFTPDSPLPGEKPNDLLIRLYEMWPAQHSTSYRRHVPVNREMTAEYNQRYMKELQEAEQLCPRPGRTVRRNTKRNSIASQGRRASRL